MPLRPKHCRLCSFTNKCDSSIGACAEDTIPAWLAWIKYLSHLYWAYMALAINNFANRGYTWSCVSQTCAQNGGLETGNDVLYYLHFNPNQLWLAFVGLFALILGYNGLGYLLLRRSKPKYLPLSLKDHRVKKA